MTPFFLLVLAARRSSGPSEILPVSMVIGSDGVTLTVTYGEALDVAHQSDPIDWAVTVDAVLRDVDAVSVPGGSTVVLTLASPVFVGQTVTLTYAQGVDAIRSDSGGVLAASFGPDAVDTSGAFDVDSIAGLILWGDVDQWTDTAGALTTAPDASGVGNDLTVSGSVTRTASDPDFNGHASVTSDGTSGYLLCEAFAGGALSPYTIYVVGRVPAATGVLVGDGATNNPRIRFNSGTSLQTLSPNSTGLVCSTGQVGIATLRSAGGVLTLSWQPFGGALVSGTVADAGATLGGLVLLSTIFANAFFTGDVASPLVYAADVDGDDDDALMALLTHRYS